MYSVKVPATSGNLGVGFDCAGLAMKLYNTTEFEAMEKGLCIETVREVTHIPLDERNLIYLTAKTTAERIGKPLGGLHLKQNDAIPHTRGLGSSAACIVAGIMIANTLLDGKMSREDILNLATELEGHPDNAAPAVYGGVCVCAMEEKNVLCKMLPMELKVAAIIPSFTLSTKRAREVLPVNVLRSAAVSNIGRMGLLITALQSKDYSYLKVALKDELHQPYRKKLIRGYEAVCAAAENVGAHATCLSGAGPTILAFMDDTAALERLNSELMSIDGGWFATAYEADNEGAIVM